MKRIKITISILAIIYIGLFVAALLFLNSKRAAEYTYIYDLNKYSSEVWEVNNEGQLIINESMETGEINTDSKMTMLPSGDYSIKIDYESSNTNVAHIYSDTNLDEYFYLSEGQQSVSFDFSVWPSTDIFTVSLIYKGFGDLKINSIALFSSTPMNTDYEYYMILILFIGFTAPIILYYLWKKCGYGKVEWFTMAVLSTMIAVVNIPVTYGYLWMGTDTRHHLMRTHGVMKALEERRIPTIIYSNYLNEYSELSCIYPDKFLYLPAILRHFNVSVITAYNTTIFLINAAAVITMYLCAKYITKSRLSAVLAAGFYCFIPYRMYVMYGGGQAYGMGIGMIFFIVLFTALYDLFFRNGKKWLLLPISMTGFLWCHILSFVFASINCAIIFVVYIVISQKNGISLKTHKEIAIKLLMSVGITVLLGLSTIVPFIYYYMQGLSVDQMKLDFLMSLGDYKSNFLSENGLFYIIVTLSIVAIILVFKHSNSQKGTTNKVDNAYNCYMILMLALGLGYFICSTNTFPWKALSKIGIIKLGLDFFQFGERFMLAGAAAVCIGFAMLMANITMKRTPLIVGILIVIAGILGVHKFNADIAMCDELCPDKMTGNIYCTEVGYIPAGTNVEDCISQIPNCSDWATVENILYLRNGTNAHYEYICHSDNNSMEFPILNYKGYKAYDGNGNEIEIKNSDKNRILINLVKSEEPQIIDIRFKEFVIFKICAVVSLLSLVGLGLLIIRTINSRRNR